MKINNKRLVALFFVVAVAIVSCQKNDNTTPSASDRDKFIGTWHVTANGSKSGLQYWDMTISASNSAPEQMLIGNFDALNGTTAYASVSGNNFSVSTQMIGNETVSGSGSYNNGNLSFKYTAIDSQTDSVTATAKK
jgi:hypothetical protein